MKNFLIQTKLKMIIPYQKLVLISQLVRFQKLVNQQFYQTVLVVYDHILIGIRLMHQVIMFVKNILESIVYQQVYHFYKNTLIHMK